MKKLFIVIFLFFSSQEIFSAVGAPCGDYGECDSFKPELENIESLQLGALTFINHCYGCHSLKYSRWGRIASDLDIPEEIFTNNLVFGKDVKLGDRMTGSMEPSVSETWFGIAPPDLTLVTRLHGSDWVYTYLRTFYEDSSKPYGVNNMVYPGAAMPNVLASLQGQQILACKDVPMIASNGGVRRDESGNDITEEKCGYLKTVEDSGSLSVEEFDEVIFNLVNFMTYVGEPSRVDRERMGWYAILFFVVFTALSYLLFREYQKDYH
jgi:cytochrome c1